MKTTTKQFPIEISNAPGNFREFEVFIAHVRRLYPNEDQQATCTVHGVEHLTCTIEVPMTREDELQAEIDQLKLKGQQLHGLIPRVGEVVTEDQVALWHQVLGS